MRKPNPPINTECSNPCGDVNCVVKHYVGKKLCYLFDLEGNGVKHTPKRVSIKENLYIFFLFAGHHITFVLPVLDHKLIAK